MGPTCCGCCCTMPRARLRWRPPRRKPGRRACRVSRRLRCTSGSAKRHRGLLCWWGRCCGPTVRVPTSKVTRSVATGSLSPTARRCRGPALRGPRQGFTTRCAFQAWSLCAARSLTLAAARLFAASTCNQASCGSETGRMGPPERHIRLGAGRCRAGSDQPDQHAAVFGYGSEDRHR